MSSAPSQPAARDWAVLSTLLALGALAMYGLPREALDWQPGRMASEPWRAWTAAFVHLSPGHLQANLLGCGVVAMFGIAAGVPRSATLAWLVAWPLTHAALALQPGLLHYAGLSGVLHAGVAIAALWLCRRGTGRSRWIGAAVLAGLALKLGLEQSWLAPTQVQAGWDIRIAGIAHLSGSVAGLACGAVAQALDRGRVAPAQ